MRSINDILASKKRIEAAIGNLRAELEVLDIELSRVQANVTLNDRFFHAQVCPILLEYETGISSSDLRSKLTKQGFEITDVSFRTFLSRQKSKSRLVLKEQATSGGRQRVWSLDPKYRETLKKLDVNKKGT